MDATSHDLLNPSSAVTNFFTPETRTPSRSPRRSDRGLASGAENIYRDLSPSKTLRAIIASSGPTANIPHDEETLINSIESATDAEKAFGVKVAEGSKLVKQWCAELDAWPWQGDFSPPTIGEDEDSGDVEARTRPELKTPDEDFWGSLSGKNVTIFEQRLKDIKNQLLDLDIEGQKQHVLHSHQLNSTETNGEIPELPTAAEYTHLDGLTALITVTVLQALPFYSKLATLISVWAARLAVLRQVPGLFRELSATRKALDKAWYSLKAGPAIAFNASVVSEVDQTLGPDSYHGTQAALKENIEALGLRIDVMLDALEGHEETLPDSWIDMVETLEEDYVGWSEEMEAKLSRDRAPEEYSVLIAEQAAVQEQNHDQATNELVNHRSSSSVNGEKLNIDDSVVNEDEEAFKQKPELEMEPREGISSRPVSPLPKRVEDIQLTTDGSHRQSVTFALPTGVDTEERKAMGNLLSFGIAEDEDDHSVMSRDVRAESDEIQPSSRCTEQPDSSSAFEELDLGEEMTAHPRASGDVESSKTSTPTAAMFNWGEGIHRLPAHQYTKSGDSDKPIRRFHRPQDSVAFSEVSIYHSVGSRDSMDSSGSLFFTPDISKRGSVASSQDLVTSDHDGDAAPKQDGTSLSANDNRNSISSRFSEPLDFINEAEETDDSALEMSSYDPEQVVTTPTLPKTSSIPRLRKVPIIRNATEEDNTDDFVVETPLTFARARASSMKMDKLDREIDQILTKLPAPVLFAKDAVNNPPQYGISSTRSGGSRRSLSPVLRRQATPELTLAPAQQNDSKSTRDSTVNDIRLYYLTPAGRDPIKLYVRLVGANDERVMVRVGGGWADLADYLNEYALHHRRAATFSEIPGQPISNGTRTPSAPSALRERQSFTTGGQSPSNIPLPRIAVTPKTATGPRAMPLSYSSSGRRTSTPTLRRPGTAGSDTSSIYRSSTPLSQRISEDGLMDSPGESSPSSGFIHAGNLDITHNGGFDDEQSPEVKNGTKIPRFSGGGMFRDLGSVGKTRRIFRVSGSGNDS